MANFCPNCGNEVDPRATECPSCKANLNNNVIFSDQDNNQKKRGMFGYAISLFDCCGCVILVFIVAIIVVLAPIAIPNYKKARESAKRKACYCNQRILMDAVEMYNKDNSEIMDNLDIPKLIESKYLKPINPPEPQCSYTSEGKLSEGGYVKCKYHGSAFKQ